MPPAPSLLTKLQTKNVIEQHLFFMSQVVQKLLILANHLSIILNLSYPITVLGRMKNHFKQVSRILLTTNM